MYLDVCLPQTIFAIIYIHLGPIALDSLAIAETILINFFFFSPSYIGIHRDENNKVKLRKKGHLFHLS